MLFYVVSPLHLYIDNVLNSQVGVQDNRGSLGVAFLASSSEGACLAWQVEVSLGERPAWLGVLQRGVALRKVGVHHKVLLEGI